MAKLLGLFQDPQQVADAMDELKKNEFPPQDLDIYSGSPFPEGTFGEHDPNHRLFMFPLVGALIGFSIGLLDCPASGREPLDALLATADARMYEQKRGKR